jgi:hypothetical protein
MSELTPRRPTRAELEAELGTALPAKEVLSLLDLNIDIDLALALAAPIDLAVAGNLNVAAPIDAAVSANVLSIGSEAAAQSTQGVIIDQSISGEAIATAQQDAALTQGDGGTDGGDTGETTDATVATASLDGTTDDLGDTVDDVVDTVDDTVDGVDDTVDEVVDAVTSVVEGAGGTLTDVGAGGLLDGNLVNVDVKVALDADLAAPIAGAVALNANIAAPIDAAAAANVGSIDSSAIAVTNQQAIITQQLDDVSAVATADQTADVDQAG